MMISASVIKSCSSEIKVLGEVVHKRDDQA